MGFWHTYMGIYGGGTAAAPTQPNDGWIAETRIRLFVPQDRERLWIPKEKP